MNFSEYKIQHTADICVIGGGMSGLIAAVAAARHGATVVLMQDRPVLGGNASSEIRMGIRGAHGKENRESGILQEIELENIYRNPAMNYSIWDTVLYQTVIQEKNITLLLNCSCLGCETKDGLITGITGWQLDSYTFHEVRAELFIDCSGDSILAPLSGAKFRVGREEKAEFDEYGACDTADRCTMGSSLLIEARETDHPCPFIAPEWAYVYPDDESMYLKSHDIIGTDINFWWIELGGRQDTIRDAEEIQSELIKVAYGVWDHLKNRGDHGMENWELEWIGFLPGKRESRRYEGAYLLNQRDLEEGSHFEDTVAFGGWTMDNHSPDGFKYMGYSSRHIETKKPYEIPFRCLYSCNVPNLMFAGRNISTTHLALSSTRVMATCSVMGQAAGTGAAIAVRRHCLPDDVDRLYIKELQKLLIEDGCFLPGVTRQVPDTASLSLSPEETAILRNGWERPHEGSSNCISLPAGGALELNLTGNGEILRLALDPDFSRESISPRPVCQKFALRSHVRLTDQPLKMPKNLLKSCTVTAVDADGKETVWTIKENRMPLIRIRLPKDTVRVTISNLAGWGDEAINFFACDVS